MKKYLLFSFVTVFIFGGYSVSAYSFTLKSKRDPFMDLLRLQDIEKHKSLLLESSKIKKESEIIRKMRSVAASIKIQAIIYSKKNSSLNTALLVGPSGIPVVAYKNYQLEDGVYISKIMDDGIVISFNTPKGIKNITVKMSKK